jgi:hypothetical protein
MNLYFNSVRPKIKNNATRILGGWELRVELAKFAEWGNRRRKPLYDDHSARNMCGGADFLAIFLFPVRRSGILPLFECAKTA